MTNTTTFGGKIRELRESLNMPLRTVAEILDIDMSLLAKYERNERFPNTDLIISMAKLFNIDHMQLLMEYFSDKIAYQIIEKNGDVNILKLAEEKVNYIKQKKLFENMDVMSSEELVDVSNIETKGAALRTVSLFSGCGGMDQGFIGNFTLYSGKNRIKLGKNNFEIIWANDIDKGAVNSYKINLGEHIHHKDIGDVLIDEIPDCDVVIGGFPCQDFSIAGKQRGFSSERGNLYKQMIRVVMNKKPKAFVAENVKNIMNPRLIDAERNQPVIQTIVQDFEALGYDVKYKCLYAPDYGIPQRRERVFIVGVRKDLNLTFNYPKPHHAPMTSKQAIDDLWGKEADPTIHNHNQISLAKFRPPSKYGMQGNEMIPENGPSHTMRAEHHMNIQAHYRITDSTKDKNDRNYWRRLTVREAARIQTFPDNFKFEGSKSDCYKQVGNAVPPMLGWYIARALEKCLSSNTHM